MLKKTISYTDYDGRQRQDDCYFNYSAAEIAEMQLSADGGIEGLLQKMIDERNNKKLTMYFKQFILGAYGEKSTDGKRFIKSEELSAAFAQTEAYSQLFLELLDAKKLSEFVKGCMPANVQDKIKEYEKNQENVIGIDSRIG